MQQLVVPQFIEVEDKIFGPVTTRQFMILLAGGLIVFLGYRFGDLGLFAFTLAVVGGLSLVFAFGKVNGQLFHYFLLNIIQTMRRPGIRIWRKHYSREDLAYYQKRGLATVEPTAAPRKAAKRARIRDLALVVNTGGYYRAEDEA